MKAICYMLTLMLATIVASAQSVVPVNTFDTRDYLPLGDLFTPEDGVAISWNGEFLEVVWCGQSLIVDEHVDRFGRLEFFATADPEAEEGVLPDDFVFIEADLGITSLGHPILTISIVYDDRVDAQRIQRIDLPGGTVIMAKKCDCKDGIGLTCKPKDCDNAAACSAGTSTCDWKPARIPPAIIAMP